MSRNLIGLIDGTMVSASQASVYQSYSNVFELACLLQLTDRSEDGSPQIVFYTSGISSQPDNSSIYNLATGNSIQSQVIDQYTNLCANFDFKSAQSGKPDRIFLFGFSRGAMAIRAVAGLIAEFGLLHPRDIRHLPLVIEAWDKTRGKGSLPDEIKLIPVEIDFIGLFDSVMGGVEWLSLFNPIRFNNPLLPARCKHGIQILAIDENRTFFKPKQWEGTHAGRTAAGRKCSDRYLRQIWMPGVHSDVGGTANPIWGRAALLAMTFYLNKLTPLSLDTAWLAEKEASLRNSLDDRRLFIKRHKGFFSRYVRKPMVGENAQQRRHPICDQLDELNYDGKERFKWRDRVFKKHFADVITDDDLEAYFRHILCLDEAEEQAAA